MRKISLTAEADQKFQVLLKKLEALNPQLEKQTGPAVSALISYIADHGDDSLHRSMAEAMTSVSRRRRALQDLVRRLSKTDDVERLEALEKGLGRLENRLEKTASAPTSDQGE